MRILIAPNAFKNSVDAEIAAQAIKEGLADSKLTAELECFSIGDGGDGTANLIIKKLGGDLVETEVADPFGRRINTSFGLIENGKTAIVEMANASGLSLLKADELNPLVANTFGTGEQIRTALNRGVKKIIVGMGGSATVDGGCGILSALGIKFLNARGEELKQLPQDLKKLHSIDQSGMVPGISKCEIVVLCDVDNELLGEQGSAKVFGPQKGASPKIVKELEECLTKLSMIIFQHTGLDLSDRKYGGTAGGAAAGLSAVLNAKLVNGIEYFLEITEFEKSLAQSDLLITAEGSIDKQTLQGKGPFGVARLAKSRGIPVIGLAGMVPLSTNESLYQYFDVLMPISHKPLNLQTALQCTFANLKRTAFEIGNLLALDHIVKVKTTC
jgi:glycerate kinase